MKILKVISEYIFGNSVEKELRMLTDRELSDIGINRGDIYRISRT